MKLLEADGWRVIRQRGSHRQLRHATKPGLVTVPGTPGHELAAGTLHKVLKRAGLKEARFSRSALLNRGEVGNPFGVVN